MGFALSSQMGSLQATYNYTGGPLGAMPPFTPSMHVSATLQLGSWLPPNYNLAECRKLDRPLKLVSGPINVLIMPSQ